jgi:CIC family chloride channel protein
LGDFPAFEVPQYELVSPLELIPYAILGLLAGLVALLFIKTLYTLEDFFDELNLNGIVKTMMGGLVIGMVGMFVPNIFGVGYNSMNMALLGQLPWITMFFLIFIKLTATSISLGSGGSGGIFAPSLFLGTMTGGAFGYLVHQIIPSYSATSGAYSLVGMGAVVAGATHAPITAILIIFELTSEYKIILPLMIASIIATLLTTKLQKESIYTLKLIRRGVDLFRGREINLLRSLKVSEVIKENPIIIPPEMNFKSLLEVMVNSPQSQFYVVDRTNRLVGMVSLQEVRRALLDQEVLADLLIALDLVNPNIPHVKEDDDLDAVMKLFGKYEIEELPVVASQKNDKIVGTINRKDVIDVYNKELIKQNLSKELSSSVKLLDRIQTVDFIEGYVMSEIPLPPKFVGRSIKEVDIRAQYGTHILMIKRQMKGGETTQLMPSANEILHKRDILVVIGSKKAVETMKHLR